MPRSSRAPVAASALLATLLGPSAASAQQHPQLPPPAADPPPAQYQPPPSSSGAPPPQPGYGQPGYGPGYPPQQPYNPPPQPGYTSPEPLPPPAVQQVVSPELETHAPKYSLWAGGRASYVGFGFSFYENEKGNSETTGNYLRNGIAPQIDVGARISYRYVPYLFWEHGFMGQGHRFAGGDAAASTNFYGIGFRYLSGDVDSVAFLTDLSVGKREVTVSNGSQTYTMSGIEFFRLGLGAEIRVSTLFTLTPLFSISSGAFNDTEGDISFKCAPSCADGVNGPTYKNGRVIEQARAYVVLSLGLGVHFDLFGK
jgi:hypothetical protein